MEAITRSSLPLLLILLALPALAAPVATVPMNTEGLEIDVTAVERRNNVVTVKWMVRNSSAEQQTAEFALVHGSPSTYLVDEESGTKYFVLTDKEGAALASEHVFLGNSSGIRKNIAPGQAVRLWMKLPAPPPEVKAVNIFFTDAAEPLEAVPITDK